MKTKPKKYVCLAVLPASRVKLARISDRQRRTKAVMLDLILDWYAKRSDGAEAVHILEDGSGKP